jgi:hypothetical protein
MRILYGLLFGLVMALAIPAAAGAQVYEYGKDRPGGDLSGISGTPGPIQCEAACAGNPACKAWTWVNPGVQGPQPSCYLKGSIPAQKNDPCCTSGVKLTAALPPGAAAGRDRPGGDYSSFNLPGPNPGACASACQGDATCKAWTYVNPGVFGPQARCYLKSIVPAETAATCCISGAKLPPPPPGAQNNRNRPGSDYAAFNLVSPNPQFCYDACQADGSCTAWTYVRPGVQGPKAVCYLKNPTPAAVVDNCCISGAKGGPPPPPLPPGAQLGKDRPGNDIASMPLPAANPQLCFDACQGNAGCKAWTYVRPGVQGPKAVCYLKNPAPAAIGNPCCISGAKLVLPPPPPPLPPGAQANRDRPGNDFAVFALSSADPTDCFNACSGNPTCTAWTYAKPGTEGAQAMCHLKKPTPPPVADTCCISGAKAAPPPPPPETGGPFEMNVNRPGGDYIDFASGGAHTALLCLAACQSQPACKAWTFVKPGFDGPQSHCYLKSFVPPADIDNCCVSGVKQ